MGLYKNDEVHTTTYLYSLQLKENYWFGEFSKVWLDFFKYFSFYVSGIKQCFIVTEFCTERLPLLLLSPEKCKTKENAIASFAVWGKKGWP